MLDDMQNTPSYRHKPFLHIVHTESSLGWGGQELRILNEALGMMHKGHRVTLICSPRSRILAAARDRRIPVCPLNIDQKGVVGAYLLHRALNELAPDVINTHSSTDSWLVAAVNRLRIKNKIPIVRTRHISSPIPQNIFSRWVYQKGVNYIVTTGESIRRQLIDQVGCHSHAVISIPTGIDLTVFAPADAQLRRSELGLPKEAFLIGIAATLRSWKGHSYLLEAMARLPQEVTLVIIGDGPQTDNLKNLAQELRLNGRVRFVGHQQHVAPWLQALDLFVLPSWANEGVPQALMQAMACRLPVISTPVGSIAEIIEDQVTGWMTTPRNTDHLTSAIETLLKDEKLRASMAEKAFERAQERFCIHKMLDAMEETFYRVTAPCGGC